MAEKEKLDVRNITIHTVGDGKLKHIEVLDNNGKLMPGIVSLALAATTEGSYASLVVANPYVDIPAVATVLYESEQSMLDCLNYLFAIQKINVAQLNTSVPFRNQAGELRKLEASYPELGVANYGKETEGVSVFSLIATITAFLANGKRLAFDIDDDNVITGVRWWTDPTKSQELENVAGEGSNQDVPDEQLQGHVRLNEDIS